MFIILMSSLSGLNSLMACKSFKFYAENGNSGAAFLFVLNASTAVWCAVQAVRQK